ncbi:putative glycolipid-binding domain-containing protein [Streptomyces sp. NPDC048603]|uniref:putative glycolipid-binding domain-containing protein n=1 Tax=Streptomyces sp. NPDC048603 TaxID=3365577 RepID=UPI00371F2156
MTERTGVTEHHVLTWDVTASGGLETSWVELGAAPPAPGGLRARGRAVGTEPEPYWLSYALETDESLVTRHLTVRVEDASRVRELDLRRSTAGHWTADGRPRPDLEGALDCDLGLCPLTNTMPVLRHGLLGGPGEHTFLMAWVSVPDLAVRPSRQTYTHLRATEGGGALVRYSSGDFTADVEFDADGLVVDYPRLARRRVSA